MASRRSRLQVKPNIGGPKGLPGKSSSKSPSTIDNDKITSPSNNDKQLVENITKDDNKSEKLKSTGTDQTVENTPKGDGSLGKDISVGDNVSKRNSDNPTSDTDNSSKDSTSVLPTRARLRRFGKVNLSIARGATDAKDDKSEQSEKKKDNEDNKAVTKDTKEPSGPSDKDTVEGTCEDNKSSKMEIESTSKQKETTEIIPRRSRFPKAKPNISDAGKRRQKQTDSISNDETLKPGIPPADTPTKLPGISVTPAEDGSTVESVTSPKTALPDSGVQLTQIQSKPTLPRSPLKSVVTPSLVASPVKQLPGAEKRVRTISTTEAPVIKKPKKPKIDAPTDKPADRTTMRMRDLIHWNPSSNPMKIKEKANAQEMVGGIEKENLDKGKVEPVKPAEEDEEEDVDSALPVPQVTIGPDGNIVINERSLVVHNPDNDKGASQEDMVIDETDMITTYASFRKRSKAKRWNKKETAKFYKVLGMIGIDFFLINQLFPGRTRCEIKQKFKREEKKNRVLIEKVLEEGLNFDPTLFDGEDGEELSEEEEEETEKKVKVPRGRKKKEKPVSEEEISKEKKKPTKRRKRPLNYNYYEDSHSEEEPEQKKVPYSDDVPWQPPCVSKTDGDEVVGILMDMSEGRIPTSGQAVENVMEVETNDDILIAKPVTVVKNIASNMPMNTNQRNSLAGKDSHIKLPGIQSIITMKAEKCPTNTLSSNSNSHTSQIKTPVTIDLNPTNKGSPGQYSVNSESVPVYENISRPLSQIPNNLTETNQVTMSQVLVTESIAQGIETAGTCSTQTVTSDQAVANYQQAGHRVNTTVANTQITSQPSAQFQFMDGAANANMQIMSPRSALVTSSALGLPTDLDDNDQYVLVTVVPEGSDETVIHIYRVHGGVQSNYQDTSTFLGQQFLSIPSTSIDNADEQSLTSNPDVENV